MVCTYVLVYSFVSLQVLLDHEEGIQLCSVTELYHHNTPLHVAAREGKAQALKVTTLPCNYRVGCGEPVVRVIVVHIPLLISTEGMPYWPFIVLCGARPHQ